MTRNVGGHIYWTLLILISCAPQEEILQGIPRVTTQKEVLVGEFGVLLKANVLTFGTNPVIEHGFEWRESGKDVIDFVRFGSLDKNTFSAEINRGFEEQKTYEGRAYIRTIDFRAYGEWVQFKGAGSEVPKIELFSPQQATWGDTITIRGNNFSFNHEIVAVEFADVRGNLVSTTDSVIQITVPFNYISSSNTQLKVIVGNKFANSNESFLLSPLQITNLSPEQGGSGTQIKIKGKYFNPFFTSVAFGTLPLSSTIVNADSLLISVPKEVPPGKVNITVTSGPFELVLINAFHRNYPKVNEILPANGFYGDTIILRGENFGSQFIDNQVWVNESEFAPIIESDVNKLSIVIPLVVSPQLEFTVFADHVKHKSDILFRVDDPNINSVLPNGVIYPGQDINIKGNNFIPRIEAYQSSCKVLFDNVSAIVKSVSSQQIVAELPLISITKPTVEVLHFDSISTALSNAVETPVTKSSVVPGMNRTRATSFTIGQKTYILTGNSGNNQFDNLVHIFDPQLKSWTTGAPFPGELRYNATAFSINNKGYLLGGFNNQGLPLSDLWEFDPALNTWNRKNDCLFHPQEAFNLNGEIYLISDITYIVVPPSNEITGFSYNPDLWKYDPLIDSWVKKATPPHSFNRLGGNDFYTMQIDGSLLTGFLTSMNNYQSYSYESSLDQWIARGPSLLTGNSPITFEYNGKGFAITNQNLYEYNPGLNMWTLIETNLKDLWQGGQPIKFKAGNSWFFGLYSNNGLYPFIGGQYDHLNNAIIEINCQIAAF
jgi:hypothetical protein